MTTSTNTNRRVDEIRSQIANLKGDLSEIKGTGLLIWDGTDGGTDWADIPSGPGYLLHVSWALSEHSSVEWYRDLGQARAALLAVALASNAVPSKSGLSVDLTSPGCETSRAWIVCANTEAAEIAEYLASAEVVSARTGSPS